MVRNGTMAYVIGEGKKPGRAAAGETVVVLAGESSFAQVVNMSTYNCACCQLSLLWLLQLLLLCLRQGLCH